MAAPSGSGASSGSTLVANSGSEGDLQHVMDQRTRKRMLSNRESARRSRLRKQKLLDDLTAQVAHLREENHRILTNLKATTQQHMAVESENSVLRARLAELSSRLQSLEEILQCMDGSSTGFSSEARPEATDGFLIANPWSLCYANQAMMAVDVFQY